MNPRNSIPRQAVRPPPLLQRPSLSLGPLSVRARLARAARPPRVSLTERAALRISPRAPHALLARRAQARCAARARRGSRRRPRGRRAAEPRRASPWALLLRRRSSSSSRTCTSCAWHTSDQRGFEHTVISLTSRLGGVSAECPRTARRLRRDGRDERHEHTQRQQMDSTLPLPAASSGAARRRACTRAALASQLAAGELPSHPRAALRHPQTTPVSPQAGAMRRSSRRRTRSGRVGHGAGTKAGRRTLHSVRWYLRRCAALLQGWARLI